MMQYINLVILMVFDLLVFGVTFSTVEVVGMLIILAGTLISSSYSISTTKKEEVQKEENVSLISNEGKK